MRNVILIALVAAAAATFLAWLFFPVAEVEIVVGPPECSPGNALIEQGGLPYCELSQADFECESKVGCQLLFSTLVDDMGKLPQGDRLRWTLTADHMQTLQEPNVGLYGTSAYFYVQFDEPGEYKARVTVAHPYGRILDIADFVIVVK